MSDTKTADKKENKVQYEVLTGVVGQETLIRKIFRKVPPLIMLCMLWLLFIFCVAVFWEKIAPMDYMEQDLRNRLSVPVIFGGDDTTHLLGTDSLGRDFLSRLIRSIRTSLLVAFCGTIITAVAGTALGFIAAHFRGWVDEVIMMLVDFQYSLPFMILALLVIAFFGNNLVFFVFLLGIEGWNKYARLSRGMALSAQNNGYAVAIRQLGASPFRLYARHILPNVSSILIVELTLNFPQKILAETSLSFLGLGIQPPDTSLGSLLAFGRAYMMTNWWLAVIPGVTIFLTTLCMCLLGDWVRDTLDPTIRK